MEAQIILILGKFISIFLFLIGELNDESQFIFNSDYDDYRIDKYLQPPLFHKKHFSLIFKNKQDNLFTVGFHHGAMFGGEILAGENIIKPRNTFESFLDVFILRTNTYQDYDINGEGNHLGFWNFQLKTKKFISILISILMIRVGLNSKTHWTVLGP